MGYYASPIRSTLDFLGHVVFWVLLPVAIYVVYVLVDVTFWPGRDHLPELVARLPFLVGQILPVAVFAATSGRSRLFAGRGLPGRPHLWIAVALLAGAAYAILALVDPLLAPYTGSDAVFPAALAEAVEAARGAALTATGPESEAYLRESGGYLMGLVVPFTTAAMVLFAAGFGSLVGIEMRDVHFIRCLAGGLFSGACWGPLPIADSLAGNLDLPAAGMFGLILAIHLALPALIATMVAVSIWRSDR